LLNHRTQRSEGQETAALYRISAAITATLDLTEVLHRIISETVPLLDAQSASSKTRSWREPRS
jgi:hypothetical protein